MILYDVLLFAAVMCSIWCRVHRPPASDPILARRFLASARSHQALLTGLFSVSARSSSLLDSSVGKAYPPFPGSS